MLKMLPPKKSIRQLSEERLENLWNNHPEIFDLSRNCRELERLERTWDIIKQIPSLENKVIIDIGCGSGELALRLKSLGATVHVLDGSAIPLRNFQNDDIQTIQGHLPKTKLEDGYYDIVICTDVLAYLAPQEHRLLILELSRIVKKEGYVICSTGLDIYSEDPLNLFQSLVQTEFIIDDWIFSYHASHIKMRDFLEGPRRLTIAGNKSMINTLWKALAFLLTPLTKLFRYNRRLLLAFESFTRTFKQEAGISHAIFIGKRKPLF